MTERATARAIAGISIGIAVVAFGVHVVVNHRRVRSTAKTGHIVVKPPGGASTTKPYPLIFLPGTSQNANSWLGRMKILAERGWECHALNITWVALRVEEGSGADLRVSQSELTHHFQPPQAETSILHLVRCADEGDP